MNMKSISQVKANPKIPKVSPGDMVKVSFRVKEASRERLQTLPGLVIKVNKGIGGGSFTIRRVTSAIGVEHTFPFASPLLEKVEIVRHGKVRRAKLYYIRRLSAKEARLKERREKLAEELAAKEGVIPEGIVVEVAEAEAASPDETMTDSSDEVVTKAKVDSPKEATAEDVTDASEDVVAEAEATSPDEAAAEVSVTEHAGSDEAKKDE